MDSFISTSARSPSASTSSESASDPNAVLQKETSTFSNSQESPNSQDSAISMAEDSDSQPDTELIFVGVSNHRVEPVIDGVSNHRKDTTNSSNHEHQNIAEHCGSVVTETRENFLRRTTEELEHVLTSESPSQPTTSKAESAEKASPDSVYEESSPPLEQCLSDPPGDATVTEESIVTYTELVSEGLYISNLCVHWFS